MTINTNRWNKLRYTLYTPAYDSLGKIFTASRRKAISALQIEQDDKILIVGAGTGLDLEFLPADCSIIATDLTPSMVERIKLRNKNANLKLEALVMDGQKLSFRDNSFDKVILHLILAVIPDPVACICEVERVLRPGGKISILDKFVPKGRTASFGRKLLNSITTFLFSDITRNIEKIISHTDLKIISDSPANFHGNFRILLVEKPER